MNKTEHWPKENDSQGHESFLSGTMAQPRWCTALGCSLPGWLVRWLSLPDGLLSAAESRVRQFTWQYFGFSPCCFYHRRNLLPTDSGRWLTYPSPPVPGAILGHHFLKTSSSRGCKQRWRLKDEGQGGGSMVKGTQHHTWWPEIDSWVSLVEAVKKWFLPSCPQTSTHTPQGMCPHTHTKEN